MVSAAGKTATGAAVLCILLLLLSTPPAVVLEARVVGGRRHWRAAVLIPSWRSCRARQGRPPAPRDSSTTGLAASYARLERAGEGLDRVVPALSLS